jgi:SAM-dependent methyltransferase
MASVHPKNAGPIAEPVVHESERWDAVLRRRRREAGCIVEWEGDDDPESLFVELVEVYAPTVSRILGIAPAVAGNTVSLDLSLSGPYDAEDAADYCMVLGDICALPFADGVFDLICSCPMPGAEAQPALQECERVLSDGGTLLGLVTGETHRIEAQEIFGRGVGWPPAKPVRFAIPEAMRAAGLEVSFLAEYFGASHCPDIESFATEALSIIPDFDPGKDAALVREVQRKLMGERGIRNTEHLVLYAAWKRA